MTETIKKLMKNVSYLITFILTIVGLYTFFSQEISERYGTEDDNLQILNVKFVPSILFFDKKSGFYGDSEVILTVKNFGNKTIRLTSDKIDIYGDQTLNTKCNGIGVNVLNEKPQESSVIAIKAGEEKEFTLSKHISFKKVIKYFDSKEFDSTLVSKFNNQYLLHEVRLEDKFKKFLQTKYYDASIHIRLYTQFKKIIKDHTVKLGDGGDYFNADGKIHYNSFLAEIAALKQGIKKLGVQSKTSFNLQ